MVAVRFTIETLTDFDLPNEVSEPKQLTFDNELVNSSSFLAEACNNEFTDTQMEQVFQSICLHQFDDKKDSLAIARYHFLAENYARLNVASERSSANNNPIKNRFAYFLKIIKPPISEK